MHKKLTAGLTKGKFLLSFKGANKLLHAFFVLMLGTAVALDVTDCEMEQKILADHP